MDRKCLCCGEEEAIWAWQPFGPGEDIMCFSGLGSHYRGFPVIAVGDDCKQDVEDGRPGVIFTYKRVGYVALDGRLEETPF